jgi:oligopeptide transport system substrate-binding protein
MNINNKFYLIFVFISTILFLSCGDNTDQKLESVNPSPKYGGTLHLLLESPTTLDPVYLDDVYESEVVNQIFEGLLTYDNNMNLKPALADYWEISPDKMIYTFYLKQGVRFHNGRELTADDFVKSFTRLLKSDVSMKTWGYILSHLKGLQASNIRNIKSVEGLQSIDKYTLRISLTEPVSLMLYLLATENFYVVPVEEIEKIGEEEFSKHPVGCGPFKFLAWEKNKQIVLAANEDYYQGRPYIDSLILKTKSYTPKESYNQFINKEIDLTNISKYMQDEFEKKNYKKITRPELSIFGLGFNMKMFPFNITKVRQAIYYAILNDSITGNQLHSDIPAKSILPSFMSKFIGQSEFKKYDIEKAKKLLNEAGFKDGKGIGTLELWTPNTQIPDKIIDNLKNMGLNVIHKTANWDRFVNILDGKKAAMFTFTWVADYPDPPAFYSNLLSSSGSDNYFNFNSKLVDSLLSSTHRIQNFSILKEINQRIETVASDSVPFVPILHRVNNFVVQSYVMNLNINSYGLAAIKLNKVWLNK